MMKWPFADLGMRNVALLTLPPLVFAVAAYVAQMSGGPYWMWHTADPSYFYLFDALNLAQFTWPGHPFHPGTPVQVIGAVVLKAAHPFLSNADLVDVVLDAPEAHLQLIGRVIVAVQAIALFVVGAIVYSLTRRHILAVLLQASPLFSMVIFKNTYHVKPEAFLIIVMLTFIAIALGALRHRTFDGPTRARYAIGFGLIAGIGIATKLTAAPIFLAPVFLLGGFRPVLIYGVSAVVTLAVCLLPAAGSLDLFFSFAGSTISHTGAYGSGGAGLIDLARYPADLFTILKRPAAGVPILLSLLILTVARRRKKSGGIFPSPETRMLAGIGLAIFAQALAVAKQPTANYMVPSYMLFAFSIYLVWQFVAKLDFGGDTCKTVAPKVFGTVLAVLIASSCIRVGQQIAELQRFQDNALAQDDSRFNQCAQIYFFPASSPSFALNLGNWWTGSRYNDAVAKRVAKNTYWFDQNAMEVRDSHAKRDLRDIAAAYPCLMLRGAHTGGIEQHLNKVIAEHSLERTCSTPDETVLTTRGVCDEKK